MVEKRILYNGKQQRNVSLTHRIEQKGLSSGILYIYLYCVFNFRVTLKEMKAFLPRINCKISTSKLREAFQEVDTRKRNEIGFDDFTLLHNRLIFDENVQFNIQEFQILLVILI